MLGPAAAVQGPKTQGAILATAPGEDLALNGEGGIVALPTGNLHNAQGSQAG